MTFDEAWKAMDEGRAIRRPSWEPGRYMVIESGIEKTYEGEKVIAWGYRVLSMDDEPTDWETCERAADVSPYAV